MELREFLWLIPSAFILSCSILLSILFFTIKSKNRKANIYLGLFLSSIAINIFNDFLVEFQVVHEFGNGFLIIEPFLFILPLLLFYVLQTINHEVRYWHYLLFLPGILHNMLLYFGETLTVISSTTAYEAIVYFLEIILMLYAYRILNDHYKSITNYYSDLENKTLSWIKSIFALNILIHSLNISTFIIDISHLEVLELTIDTIAIAMVCFMIFWLTFNGFTQTEIFQERLFLVSEHNLSLESLYVGDYNKSDLIKDVLLPNISKRQIDELEPIISETDIQQFNEIKKQIWNQELFCNPKLDLRSLAATLNIKEKELSRLINECGKMNFYQFINEFRIKKFKRLMETSKVQQFTLLGLAIESGFRSKSTFYAAFKKFEGMTPKQYEKSIKKSC